VFSALFLFQCAPASPAPLEAQQAQTVPLTPKPILLTRSQIALEEIFLCPPRNISNGCSKSGKNILLTLLAFGGNDFISGL
jgi:hypothetical protein